MVTWVEVIIAAFLAYYWAGFDMVHFHTQLEPTDQPEYVRGSTWKMFVSGALWPIVSYANRELAWFSIGFLSAAIVLGAAYVGLNHLLGSMFYAVMVLGALRVTPVISALISFPLAMVSSLLWIFIAKPLGCEDPSGIERMKR
ncbi:MAG: hypothetical protein SGJ16_03680 [Nitrospirota bacterium]|nr:hypothetical protein [Nitrospirota bacterium]